MNVIILASFFLSGACALLYEVAWMRMLGLVFGVSTFAVSTVLTSYMAGLALGSYYFGRKADSVKNPIKLYAMLEAGMGIIAFAVPFIFSSLDGIYGFIYRKFSFTGFSLNAVRFILSFLVLIIPTTLMGGTLPVLSKIFAKGRKDMGASTGLLYAVNTLGAVFGCFITGFFLIRNLGVQNSIWIAAVINIAISVIFLVFVRPGSKVESQKEDSAVPALKSDYGAKIIGYIKWFFCISGFCALSYEVLWTKSMIFFLPNNTYSFSIMLTTYLAGIAIGSFIFSGVVKKLNGLLTLLGILQFLIGISAVFSVIMLYRIDPVIENIWVELGRTWWGFVLAAFINTSILMLIPTFLFGAVFPVVIKICLSEMDKTGKTIGTIYSINTAGTIAGSFIAGFILVPIIGITKGLMFIAFINVLAGAAIILLNPRINKTRKITTVSAAMIFIFVCAMVVPAGKPIILYSSAFKRTGEGNKLLYYKEGATSTVSVVRSPEGINMLSVDGGYTAFASIGDLQVHLMLSYLPYLLCNDPKNSLVIGYGMGVTAYSLIQPQTQRVDCVEIASEELEASRFFSDINHDVLNDPKFHLIIEDGRNYLLMTDKKYDIISSNAVHVKQSPNLYTTQFYEVCRKRLNPGGVMCQWMPSNWMKEEEFRGLIKSFKNVFPHSCMWYVNPAHYVLIGTDSRLNIDFKLFTEKLNSQKVKSDLEGVFMNDPYLLLSRCIMSEDMLDAYVKGSKAHDDNYPYAEFERTVSPRSSIVVPDFEFMDDITSYITNKGSNAKEVDSFNAALSKWLKTRQIIIQTDVDFWSERNHELWLKKCDEVLSINPGDKLTKYWMEYFKYNLENNYISAAEDFLMSGNDTRAMSKYEKLLQLNPGSVKALKGICSVYIKREMYEEALNICSRILRLDDNSALAHYFLGVIYSRKGMKEKSENEFAKAYIIEPGLKQAHEFVIRK